MRVPGLEKRTRRNGTIALYWVAPIQDRRAGFQPKYVLLTQPTADERAMRCFALQRMLEKWRENRAAPERTKYTIAWLVSRYQSDEFSPYRNLRARTSRGYDHFCKGIVATVGERTIGIKDDMTPRISGEDVRRWYRQWGKPNEAGQLQFQSRARHMLVMLRTLAAYAVEIGVPHASIFSDMLSKMRFPTSESRIKAPTREQVDLIVDKAIELGYRSIAITTIAQYELIERRTHIIGYWEGRQWRPGWTWDQISPEWVISYYQTKSGRVPRTFNLAVVPKLLGLLEHTPPELRVGPVIIAERQPQERPRNPLTKKFSAWPDGSMPDPHAAIRLPWRERHYATKFREIARAAGMPDDVWSMDMRAGGATEADAIHGISDRELQDAGGWKDPRTRDRYRRQKSRNAQNVVKLRQDQKDS